MKNRGMNYLISRKPWFDLAFAGGKVEKRIVQCIIQSQKQ